MNGITLAEENSEDLVMKFSYVVVASLTALAKLPYCGELEIKTLKHEYLDKVRLKIELIGGGYIWLATRTYESLFEASTFVQTIENRLSLKAACLEAIAYEKDHMQVSTYL